MRYGVMKTPWVDLHFLENVLLKMISDLRADYFNKCSLLVAQEHFMAKFLLVNGHDSFSVFKIKV